MSEKRTYYHTCERCGANLDPGERCDCLEQKIANPPESANVTEKCDHIQKQKEK